MQQNILQSSRLSWQRKEHQLIFSGELDRDTLLSFWQQRKAVIDGITELNLAGLQRVDTSGLAMLVYLLGNSILRGCFTLRLSGVSEQLQTLIELYNLQSIIAIDTQ